MAEKIGFENGRNSNFEGLVTLTLTLDPVIRHSDVHHSSTSTYNYTKFHWNRRNILWTDGRTYGRTYGRTFFPPLILFGRLSEVDLKRNNSENIAFSSADGNQITVPYFSKQLHTVTLALDLALNPLSTLTMQPVNQYCKILHKWINNAKGKLIIENIC